MRPRYFWLLIACLLFATANRAFHLTSQSLWFDEAFMVQAGQANWPAVLWAEPNHPPLYALFLFFVVRLAGEGELALRWSSLLLGLGVIVLTARLARRLFNQPAAVWAAWLAAASPLLWWASQEVRMYILTAGCVALMAESWHALLKSPARRHWLTFWAAELLLLYSHLSTPAAVIWINAATLLSWLLHRQPLRPAWRTWVVGQAGVVALWLPWLIFFVGRAPSGPKIVVSPPLLNGELLSQMWQSFWLPSWLMVEREPVLATLSGAALIGLLISVPWPNANARWLAFHFLAVCASVIAGLIGFQSGFHGRYLTLAAPLLLALVAGGLAHLAQFQRVGKALAGGLMVIFLALFGLGVNRFFEQPEYGREDVRGLARFYAERLTAADSVIAFSYSPRFDLEYYWRAEQVTAPLLTFMDNPTPEDFWARLPASGAMALNVWFQERADYRGLAPCTLAHGSRNLPETLAVPGMLTEVYAEPRQPLSLQSAAAAFAVAQVTQISALPAFTADQALCVPIRIRLTQPMETDLKALLRVKNSLGWEVARADVFFAQDNQHTTARLASGAELAAFPLVRLPLGAPAGKYTLMLTLYDEGQLSGYDVLSEAGAPAGKEWRVGEWAIQPGARWENVTRATQLPVPVEQAAGESLTLVAQSVEASPPIIIANGMRLPVSLLWRGTGPLPPLSLIADDDSWRVTVPATSTASDALRLDWREIPIPPEAESGPATLQLPNGLVIARLAVQTLPFLATPPETSTAVGVALPGVGQLVGYQLAATAFTRTDPITLTLVWQASQPTETSYTIFVQLLAADGTVVAQSDSLPAQGTRPTTTWRLGEYIADPHTLNVRTDALPGFTTLIAGMYNAETGQRLRWQTEADALTLATGVELK
ncbi:MAG: glycosyltransferase family 39 protein [Anaerolineales bacterium]|nr:glycosyltransferase family 39 protein [Anaerolineales bacterium]